MLVLAIDSAASSCAACVWKAGTVLASAREVMERGQDRRLMPLILDVMRQAGIKFDQLDRIGVTRGPGSFTGVRIGLAAARGIGIAAHKPVIGIDRFALYRHALPDDGGATLIVIQSKRAELFCQLYTPEKAAAPQMLTPDEIAQINNRYPGLRLIGDVPEFSNTPLNSASETAICAALTAKADVNDTQFAPRPLYLRPPDVTISAAAQRQAAS